MAAVSISEAMAPPWMVVPMVTSELANGSVSTHVRLHVGQLLWLSLDTFMQRISSTL